MFTIFYRSLIRLTQDNFFLKYSNFKWDSGSIWRGPLDFFERIFLAKNALYKHFRVEVGVRFLLLIVVNALAFYIFWTSFALLVELIYSMIEYNIYNNYFWFFTSHEEAADDFYVLYEVIDPIGLFWWAISVAIFFFNFSRFDHIILQRYQRVYFTLNVTEILIISFSLLLFISEYTLFCSLSGIWIGQHLATPAYYAAAFPQAWLFIPIFFLPSTLLSFQFYSFGVCYSFIIVALFLLPNLLPIFYRLKHFFKIIGGTLFAAARRMVNLSERGWKLFLAYLIFKIAKICGFIAYFFITMFSNAWLIFSEGYFGYALASYTVLKFHIFWLLIISYILAYNRFSSKFLVYWGGLLYVLVYKFNILRIFRLYITASLPTELHFILTPLSWLFILFCIATALTALLVVICLVVGPRQNYSEKIQAYECGFHALGGARENFSVNFFLLAVLFLIFDLEIVFIMPLVAKFEYLAITEFVVGVIFIFFLFLGFIYEWRRNALNL